MAKLGDVILQEREIQMNDLFLRLYDELAPPPLKAGRVVIEAINAHEDYNALYECVCEKYKNKEGKDYLYYIIFNEPNLKRKLPQFLKIHNFNVFVYNVSNSIYNDENATNIELERSEVCNRKIIRFICCLFEIFLYELRFTNDVNSLLENYLILTENRNTNYPQNAINTLTNIAKDYNNHRYEEYKSTADYLYEYFKAQIKIEDYSENTIEIGYLLTDVYERNQEFDKSILIAKKILQIYGFPNNYQDELFNRTRLRRLIGCIYSLAIARKTEREELLQDAEQLFNALEPVLAQYNNNPTIPNDDKYFILGFYYSDYGALLLNKGEYNNAKNAHEKALKYREQCKKIFNEANTIDKTELENMIGRSKLNIGYAYYYLDDYKKSTEKQKEALIIFEQQNDKSRIHQTKDCILGGYIELWKCDICHFNVEDFEVCCHYIDNLLNYYRANEDRINKITSKKATIKSIICSLPTARDKEQSKQIYESILGGE